MNRFGINVELKHVPALDPDFIPLIRFNRAFLADAKKSVGIAVERADGQMASCHTFIHGTPEMADADHYYIERIVKTLLWMKGGFKVYVSGDEGTCEYPEVLEKMIPELPDEKFRRVGQSMAAASLPENKK